MHQQPPISLQLLSQLKVKYFCSNSRHPGVRHLCLCWSQLQPCSLYSWQGEMGTSRRLFSLSSDIYDGSEDLLSEGAFLSPLKEFLWPPSPPRYVQLQLHWMNCWCWCTVLHCCDRSRMGLITIFLHCWDIWEEKCIRCLGVLFAIGGWQGSCCTQWIWFIHNLFFKCSFCEEFCSLGEFLFCTGGRDTAVLLSSGHICASFLSKRLPADLRKNSCCPCSQGWWWGLAPQWCAKSLGLPELALGLSSAQGKIQVKSGASSPGRQPWLLCVIDALQNSQWPCTGKQNLLLELDLGHGLQLLQFFELA